MNIIKETYFKNTPLYGDLYIEKVLFECEYIPIVFTCKNSENIRCLCVCDDIIESESWILIKISNSILLAVLNDDISVCKAFEIEVDDVTVINRINGNINYKVMRYSDIGINELPDVNLKLGMKNSLTSFMRMIMLE